MESKGVLLYSDLLGMRVSYSNNQPLEKVEIIDPILHITLGTSILSKSMKYMAKSLIESVISNKPNRQLPTLEQELEYLRIYERFRKY